MNELVEKINILKKEKNAVVLAHCYQNVEIDEVADYVGDSLYLSQQAAKTDADIIIFAGVYFMAQTAKMLSPDKKVLLPRMESGCLMADMINLEQLRAFKAKNPGVPAVCYINRPLKLNPSVICALQVLTRFAWLRVWAPKKYYFFLILIWENGWNHSLKALRLLLSQASVLLT